MRRIAVICILFFAGVLSCFAARRALVVTIGDYPAASGWNKIASEGDRDIVTAMLRRMEFTSIISLHDAEATYGRIVSSLETLARETQAGDEVYVHFGCHGQQITDLDGDEALRNPKDRYDEALVPYDACISYGWNGYEGEHHLLDDEIGAYMARIASAAGRRGRVLLVADACHSGDVQRGQEIADASYRGTYDAFERPLVIRRGRPGHREPTWVTISACRDFQTNFQVLAGGRMYGRLSYAISRVLRPGLTPEELVAALEKEYAALRLPAGKMQTLSYDIPKQCSGKPLFR